MPDIQNIPLIFTVLSQMLGCLLYALLGKKRIHGWKLMIATILFFMLNTGLLILTRNQNPRFSVFYLLAAILLLYLFLLSTCRFTFFSAAYCCIRGFMLAEFAAALEWLAYVWFARVSGIHNLLSEVLFMIAVYALIYGIMFYLEHLLQYDYDEMPIKWKDVIYVFAFSAAGFELGNSVKITAELAPGSSLAFYNTRALMSFGCVAILYAFHALRRELYMKNEVNALQYVVQNQYEQYMQNKENTDIVNLKYHDLKHQIMLLKKETDSPKRIDMLEKMEEDISLYESGIETGNEIVDTILSDKKRHCLEHHIVFTCVADGTLLDFMDPVDLCSILGNAMDNAIECEDRVEEKEKRIIHVLIAEQKKFVLLKIDNFCEEKVDFQYGLPRTTKDDKTFHGYGIKSMKNAVEKYQGMLTAGWENQWFELKILIPLLRKNCEK